jgi:hypothetical protein
MKPKQRQNITLVQAAAQKRCSLDTIYRRVRRGQLAVEKVDGKAVVDKRALDALTIPEGPWSNRVRKNRKRSK